MKLHTQIECSVTIPPTFAATLEIIRGVFDTLPLTYAHFNAII